MTGKQGAEPQPTRKTWSAPSGCSVISNRLGSFCLSARAPYKGSVLGEVSSWDGTETAADAEVKLTLPF